MPTVAIHPERTAIRRKGPSLPTRLAFRLLQPTDVFDFGCGWGSDVTWLQQQGVRAVGYDRHPAFGATARPRNRFALVVMNYVVNVLATHAERVEAIQDAWSYVQRGGGLFVSTRTRVEIEREARAHSWPKCEDGFLSSPSRGTFQKGHDTTDLAMLLARALPDAKAIGTLPPDARFAGVIAWR